MTTKECYHIIYANGTSPEQLGYGTPLTESTTLNAAAKAFGCKDRSQQKAYNVYRTMFRFTAGEYSNGKPKWSHTKDHAVDSNMFVIDLDVGAEEGKYQSQAEALREIEDLIDRGLLPTPTHLLNSGYGVHAYYVLDEYIEIEAWQRVVAAISAKCKTLGLFADEKVFRPSQPIRLPGTWNDKHYPKKPAKPTGGFAGKKVKLRAEYTVKELKNAFDVDQAFEYVGLGQDLVDFFTAYAGDDALFHDVEDKSEGVGIDIGDTFLDAFKLYSNCQYTRDLVSTGGAKENYSSWQSFLGLCSKMHNGMSLAIMGSNKHKDYSLNTLQSKFHDNNFKGYVKCDTLACKHRNTCPNYARGGTSSMMTYAAAVKDFVEDYEEVRNPIKFVAHEDNQSYFVSAESGVYKMFSGSAEIEMERDGELKREYHWINVPAKLLNVPIFAAPVVVPNEETIRWAYVNKVPNGDHNFDTLLRDMNYVCRGDVVSMTQPSVVVSKDLTIGGIGNKLSHKFVSDIRVKADAAACYREFIMSWVDMFHSNGAGISKGKLDENTAVWLNTESSDSNGWNLSNDTLIYKHGKSVFSDGMAGDQGMYEIETTKNSLVPNKVNKLTDRPSTLNLRGSYINAYEGYDRIFKNSKVEAVGLTVMSLASILKGYLSEVHSIDVNTPAVVLSGPTGGGKSTAVKVALGTITSNFNEYIDQSSQFTTVGIFEKWSKMRHHMVFLDEANFEAFSKSEDPKKPARIAAAIKDIVNGTGRVRSVLAGNGQDSSVATRSHIALFATNESITNSLKDEHGNCVDVAAAVRICELHDFDVKLKGSSKKDVDAALLMIMENSGQIGVNFAKSLVAMHSSNPATIPNMLSRESETKLYSTVQRLISKAEDKTSEMDDSKMRFITDFVRLMLTTVNIIHQTNALPVPDYNLLRRWIVSIACGQLGTIASTVQQASGTNKIAKLLYGYVTDNRSELIWLDSSEPSYKDKPMASVHTRREYALDLSVASDMKIVSNKRYNQPVAGFMLPYLDANGDQDQEIYIPIQHLDKYKLAANNVDVSRMDLDGIIKKHAAELPIMSMTRKRGDKDKGEYRYTRTFNVTARSATDGVASMSIIRESGAYLIITSYNALIEKHTSGISSGFDLTEEMDEFYSELEAII